MTPAAMRVVGGGAVIPEAMMIPGAAHRMEQPLPTPTPIPAPILTPIRTPVLAARLEEGNTRCRATSAGWS